MDLATEIDREHRAGSRITKEDLEDVLGEDSAEDEWISDWEPEVLLEEVIRYSAGLTFLII